MRACMSTMATCVGRPWLVLLPLLGVSEPATAAGDGPGVLHVWNFAEAGFEVPGAWGGSVVVKDGVLVGESDGSAPDLFFFLPPVNVPCPVALKLTVRTDARLFDRGEVYWTTSLTPKLGLPNRVCFPVEHEGDRQDITLRLPPVSGNLRAVRLSFGRPRGGGRFELSAARLERLPLPARVTEARSVLPDAATLESKHLACTLKPTSHTYSIIDKRTGREWIADGSTTPLLVSRVERSSPRRMVVGLWDHSIGKEAMCEVTLREDDTVTFRLQCADETVPLRGLNAYPPGLTSNLEGGKAVFCDRSSGVYMDLDDEVYSGRLLGVYGNTSCTDMPWVGVLDPARGDGVMTLVETPWDAFLLLDPDEQGRCFPQVMWNESLDTFRYARSLSYVFSPHGGYVALARRYRRIARENGLLVTLREKARRKPAVDLLKGAPIIWGGTDVWDFVRSARQDGLLRGVLSNAQHGLKDEGALLRLNQMGYLTSEYDGFSDVRDGPTGFNTGPVAEVGLHARPGAGPAAGWQDDLASYSIRSSATALDAVQTYVPAALERYGFNGRFIDVAMAIHLMEDWHPRHTFDRRTDLAQRREVFDYYDSLGLVLGTEHGNDWGIDLVEYTEGSLSGPNWWLHSRRGGWRPGMLEKAQSPEDYHPNYLKFGHRFDTRIPLWQLVYHDCAVSTWYWGDCPGMHHRADPAVSDRKDLFALLYGGVTLLWRDLKGFEWPANRDRFMQSVYMSSPLHREVGFAEMVNHEFLTLDAGLQRTRFSSGHSVVVNFADTPQDYRSPTGHTYALAPGGFLVTGPRIRQSRLWVDGAAVTSIETPEFVLYETERRRHMGPVHMSGRFVAFRVDAHRWQLALQPGHRYRMDARALTGWEAPVHMAEIDELGEVRRLCPGGSNDRITLRPTSNQRYYALLRRPQPLYVYPPSGIIDEHQPVIVSTPPPGGGIRCTWHGSEREYLEPLRLSRGGTLVVEYRGSRVTRRYELARTLFNSGLMRGGDQARPVDVPLAGMSRLRITVGNGGDDCWSDQAVVGDAVLFTADGRETPLSSIEPASARQTYGALAKDLWLDGSPLRISGRRFSHGLALQSEAEVIYDLSARYERLVGWVGVDDRSDPGPDGPEALRGTVEFTIQGLR